MLPVSDFCYELEMFGDFSSSKQELFKENQGQSPVRNGMSTHDFATVAMSLAGRTRQHQAGRCIRSVGV